MTGIERVAVIVPAADEQDSIGACLDAIRIACAGVPHVPTSVHVVLDTCRDGTAAVVATHPGVLAVLSEAGNVGAARAAGSVTALASAHDPTRVWLAHTDADSTVPADWLAQMLLDADGGADLVLGTVRPDDALDTDLRNRWLAVHDPDDGHGHVHGANLGIRASAYLALGGFAALPTGEDVDLVARAVNVGLVVNRSGRITVTTSSRAVGRAPEGFADYLREVSGSA